MKRKDRDIPAIDGTTTNKEEVLVITGDPAATYRRLRRLGK